MSTQSNDVRAATIAILRRQDPVESGLYKLLADAIESEHHFAKDSGGRKYIYDGGVYRGNGETLIAGEVKRLLIEWQQSKKWRSAVAKEVAEFIRVDAPLLWERLSPETINLSNGLLDIGTCRLRTHDPAFLSPIQIPVSLDPDAKCPATEKFLSEVLPADCQTLYFELVAWLVGGIDHIQKAVLLVGEGSNGKSTLLAALTAFLGKRNTASVSLHKLEADRFATARLVGKLANICADLPSAHLCGTSIFKALTGGDELNAERKFGESFEFRPFTRLIFSANQPPRSPDASHAFFRRWLVVPFNRTFGGEAVRRDVLDARLCDPRELSGVLNRALELLPNVRTGGITETPSMRAAWDEFRQTTDPLSVWLDNETVTEPDALVSMDGLRTAYNRASEKAGRPSLNKTAWGTALKRLRPSLDEKQRTIAGALRWAYVGIRLTAEISPESPSHGLHGLHEVSPTY